MQVFRFSADPPSLAAFLWLRVALRDFSSSFLFLILQWSPLSTMPYRTSIPPLPPLPTPRLPAVQNFKSEIIVLARDLPDYRAVFWEATQLSLPGAAQPPSYIQLLCCSFGESCESGCKRVYTSELRPPPPASPSFGECVLARTPTPERGRPAIASCWYVFCQ